MKKLLLLMMLVIMSLTSCEDEKEKSELKLERIEIINEGHIPIMKIDIKGTTYVFLLDSGSPESYIDSKVAEEKKLSLQKEEDLRKVKYNLLDKTFVELMHIRFYVHDLSQTRDKLYYHTGEYIDGVIGADVLYRNRSVIDFEKEIITNINEE